MLNTQWLLNFPKDMRIHMAETYIDTMEQDATLLKTLLIGQSTNAHATLEVVHKIKGSTAQIGLRTINQSAIYTEKLGKLASPDYPTALSSLVKEMKQSIVDVKNWKARNAKKANSPKVYSY
ncbi:Hpt domain-containing protein [Vibrio natriegens]|uniref:Hpt domain-containing protein n=1 Tax=Vibrio natriegens TaxID=691 RepID=UPI0020CF0250|nr:Hpt domain-containing protein [Vibrio natriegens]